MPLAIPNVLRNFQLDDTVSDRTKEDTVHEFDALNFLAELSVHNPKIYECFGGRCFRRAGERAKLCSPFTEQE